MDRLTHFSPDRVYRYTLWREWDLLLNKSYCMFIGLNPSTADETQDDPTVRRCIDFAKRFGCGALCMTNIFAYRATDPKVMKAAKDPIGEDNDHWLIEVHWNAKIIIAAWGNHGTHLNRGWQIREMIGKPMHCLGFTNNNQPRHPLYIAANTQPILLKPEENHIYVGH